MIILKEYHKTEKKMKERELKRKITNTKRRKKTQTR